MWFVSTCHVLELYFLKIQPTLTANVFLTSSAAKISPRNITHLETCLTGNTLGSAFTLSSLKKTESQYRGLTGMTVFKPEFNYQLFHYHSNCTCRKQYSDCNSYRIYKLLFSIPITVRDFLTTWRKEILRGCQMGQGGLVGQRVLAHHVGQVGQCCLVLQGVLQIPTTRYKNKS